MTDAKHKILARRAQFVAAALAGLAAGGCQKEDAARPDAGVTSPRTPETAPQPCLAVPLDFVPPRADAAASDAAADAAGATDASAASDAAPSVGTKDAGTPTTTPIPRPCLTIVPPSPPAPSPTKK